MDLSIDDLKKWIMPLPSLKFQSEFLNKIKNRKNIVKNASQLIKELSNIEIPDAKGKKILKEFITNSLYGISSKCKQKGKYPVLRMNNLDALGNWNLDDLKYTDIELPPHRLLQKGDFIFNRTNSAELVGKSGVIDFDFSGTWASYLIRFKFNEHLNPYYLKYLFAQKKYRKYISSAAKQSGGQANISAKQFAEIEIDYHPIPIQNQIAEKLNTRFEQIAVLKQIIKTAQKSEKKLIESIFKY
jgi:type I restriction enzyme S subunit